MRWWVAFVASLPGWLFADELVVVTMRSCQPCRRLKADLLQKPELTEGHTIRLVEGKEAMRAWDVDVVPTLIRVRDGKQVARHVGYAGPAKLKEWIDAR